MGPSLREAERRSNPLKKLKWFTGLLRCARNDGALIIESLSPDPSLLSGINIPLLSIQHYSVAGAAAVSPLTAKGLTTSLARLKYLRKDRRRSKERLASSFLRTPLKSPLEPAAAIAISLGVTRGASFGPLTETKA